MGLGGLTAQGSEPGATLLPDVQLEAMAARARVLATRPFVVQAANGAVIDQTVWGYHFSRERPDELHPSGMVFLDRLARRQLDEGHIPLLRLNVQRAQDRFPDVPIADIRKVREVIDQKRKDAITAYLAQAWPGVAVSVQFYDPRSVGMPALEAAPALSRQQGTALGYIPENFQAVQTSTKGGGPPQGGTLLPAEPVSKPGTGGASSFGLSSSPGGGGDSGGGAGGP